MKFQDALLSDKIFNFIDIPANKYKGVNGIGSLVPQYVRSIGDSAFEDNKGIGEAAFLYCKSIGKRAFYRSNYTTPPNLRFGDVDIIKEYAFYVDGYNLTWGNCNLSFGNVGTIEKYAFSMAYLSVMTNTTFCDVGTIKTAAFTIRMFSTRPGEGFKFKNVGKIETGAFNGFNGSFSGVVSFENVDVIEDNAFSKMSLSELNLPDKFRTRAELVRIGVANPDAFKID
ncbi:leucine-rich repeat protein [Campylobacter fetus]|uniref:leucine-rich repeat protein n=1 Tax=Campylobacter fetus TaxID=196 RepID=UPI00122FFF0E|nr:leucine-rich repeat protein [Campylobacter fetus]KAA3685487.1 hypothetical protein E3G72_02905 [Campylobacter fetus subsp. fetus]